MSASLLDIETKRKLREMNATDLLTAIDTQDPWSRPGWRSRTGSGWLSMRPTRRSPIPRSPA